MATVVEICRAAFAADPAVMTVDVQRANPGVNPRSISATLSALRKGTFGNRGKEAIKSIVDEVLYSAREKLAKQIEADYLAAIEPIKAAHEGKISEIDSTYSAQLAEANQAYDEQLSQLCDELTAKHSAPVPETRTSPAPLGVS